MNLSQIKQRLALYEKLMRLDKPIGILLLLWPTLWGIWISARGWPNWIILWIFLLGTVLMRSAGCVINDYADRDFDPHVARTRQRPLAAGAMPKKEALLLAAALSLLAFLIILPLNKLTMLLSLPALLLAASYPFTKRFLAIPQAYLGVAFGFGIPMAFAAQTHHVPLLAWLLLLANVCWAIAYDTEYAMVDRDDDLKIGIQSSAILFGRYDIAAVMAAHASMLAILTGIDIWQHWGVFYYLGLLMAAVLAAHQYRLLKFREPANYFAAFLNNNWVGAAIFAGIAVNFLVQRKMWYWF